MAETGVSCLHGSDELSDARERGAASLRENQGLRLSDEKAATSSGGILAS